MCVGQDAASFGDTGFFKLLFQHFAADKGAERGGQNGSHQHNDHDPHRSRGAHGVDIRLLRAVAQHGLCPTVGIGKENEVGTGAAEGKQNVGKRVDLFALIPACSCSEVGSDAHDEITQRHGPVHTGHEPDDAHNRAQNRRCPTLLNLGHHQQIHGSAEQCAAHRHIEGQYGIGGKEYAAYEGKHKKQSGGHGQYGDVVMEFEPSGDLSKPYEFEEKIFGGAVPRNYFPAVEKGIQECVKAGPLAGYPVVGIKATLIDGSYHPVDSSEMSFKIAASLAYKNGIPQANPVLLEPVGTLKALCNDEAMGDIIGDINKRRGRVLGMTPQGNGMQEILAEVPIGEMASFPTSMRQITQGRGSFEIEFARYEKVPEHIAQKIIEDSKEE